MRRIRSLVVGVLVLGASAAAASAQSSQTPINPSQPGAARSGHERGSMKGLMQGIKLNDTEKANIKAVRAKYEPQLKALRTSLKPEQQQIRAARQRGDTVAAKAEFAKTADARARMKAVMDQARGEMRSALRPENQAQFDANVAKMGQHKGHGRGQNGGRAAGQGGV